MSAKPDAVKQEWDINDKAELPAKPIHGDLAIWGPRIATLGYLGLNLWQAQRVPGPHGLVGVTFPFFGTHLPDRLAAKRMIWILASPLLIWTVEGYRVANSKTPLALPLAFGLATQAFGIASVAPIYYAYSLFSRDATGAGGKVDSLTAAAIFPATIVGHVLPSILMDTLPLTATEVSRSYFTLQSIVCYAFYLSPITVSALTKGLSAGVRWLRRRWSFMSAPVKDATNAQDAHSGLDLSALQSTYLMMIALQTAQHLPGAVEALRRLYVILEPFSWPDRLMLIMNARWAGSVSYMFGMEQGLSFSIGCSLKIFISSTVAFLLYSVWDLRRRGYITSREAVKAVTGLSAAPFAPGAAYAGMWLWRERMLYRATHYSRPQPRIQE